MTEDLLLQKSMRRLGLRPDSPVTARRGGGYGQGHGGTETTDEVGSATV